MVDLFRKMGLLLPLALILLNSSDSCSSEASGFKLIREGSLPVPASKKWRRAVRIKGGLIQVLKGTPDRLVVQDVQPGKPLGIYRLVEGGWEITDGPALIDSAATQAEFVCWTTGDIDSDGADEIVTYSGSTIWIHQWDGQDFKASRYEVSGTVDQLTVGDIDGDGRNEMVSFRYYDDPHVTNYHICVDRFEDGKLRVLWSDRGSLCYTKTDVIPSARLGAIADYENKGYNVVLTKGGQSDVSASRYRFLAWRDTALVVAKSFVIGGTLDGTEESMPPERSWGESREKKAEREKQWKAIEGKQLIPTLVTGSRMYRFPMAIGIMAPIQHQEKTLLAVPLMSVRERRLLSTETLSEIAEDVLKPIWEADTREAGNPSGPADIVLGADLDGWGEGILHITLSDETVYRFYR